MLGRRLHTVLLVAASSRARRVGLDAFFWHKHGAPGAQQGEGSSFPLRCRGQEQTAMAKDPKASHQRLKCELVEEWDGFEQCPECGTWVDVHNLEELLKHSATCEGT